MQLQLVVELSAQRSILAALKVCTKSRDLKQGREIHARITQTWVDLNVFLASSLINMYGKCGSMSEARIVFDKMKFHDAVSWTALMLGYVENEENQVALQLLQTMQAEGCQPDARVFVAALKACTNLAAAAEEELQVDEGKSVKMFHLETGMALHSQAVKSFKSLSRFLGSSLVALYGKCGAMADAELVFEGMQTCDVVVWNALMMGYVENGEPQAALDIFAALRSEKSCSPDSRSFVAAIKACGCLAAAAEEEGSSSLIDGKKLVKLSALEKGMAIHSLAALHKFELDSHVANTLVDMYANCGCLEDAERIFDKLPRRDVVSWTALMLGYVNNGDGEVALRLLEQMQLEGCEQDHRVYFAAAKACSDLAADENGEMIHGKVVKMDSLEKGMAVHFQASENGFYDLNICVATSLVDMYSKCGSMADAVRVFERVPHRNLVLWNALISGYGENGAGELALQTLLRLQRSDRFSGDERTLVAALKACSSLAAEEERMVVDDGKLVSMKSLEKGMSLHSQAKDHHSSSIFIANSLIDMYGKCGSMVDAVEVFNEIRSPDLVSWNSILLGYAQNGEGERALELFAEMNSVKDGRTFAAVLRACISLAAREEQEQVYGKLVRRKCLEIGFALHSEAAKLDLVGDCFVGNSLCDLYSHCGSMADAGAAFDRIRRRSVISWTTLMMGYVENGEEEIALQLLMEMQSENCPPDSRTFVAALKACSVLATKEDGVVKMAAAEKGMAIHRLAAKLNLATDIYVGSSLVNMYSKCGSLVDAQIVFDSLPSHDEEELALRFFEDKKLSSWSWESSARRNLQAWNGN